MIKRKTVMIRISAVAVAALIAALAAWAGFRAMNDKDRQDAGPLELSAWIADWSFESGLRDAAVMSHLNSLHWFAVYFDEKGNLTATEDYDRYFEQYSSHLDAHPNVRSFVTVVNDVWLPDGTSVQKDPGVVSRLAASAEARDRHIGELLDLVDRTGADGLELDYERIDDGDWQGYVRLIADLSELLAGRGKKLRVVLEPRTRVEEIEWPDGPEYVMMAYNLYGYHSGPGPKADHAFLEKTARRMASVPGEPVIALSLGGFEWADGRVRALTEMEAAQLARQTSATAARDEASGSLYFEYVDADGRKGTVWYADHETLAGWIGTVRANGVRKVALWRLGGMEEETIRQLERLAHD
jgi:spore germination protein YaaH